MSFKPLYNNVAVTIQKETHVGTIVLPTNHSMGSLSIGRVETVGPEVEAVKAGDLVVFPKYGGASLEKEGVEIINAKTILGILQD
jgi:co-chaperonin GroES (HSP10)